MKNKTELKKTILSAVVLLCCFLLTAGIWSFAQYRLYTKSCNERLDAVIGAVLEEYPKTDKNEILKILESENPPEGVLREYGIDIKKDSYIAENKRLFRIFTAVTLLMSSFFLLSSAAVFLRYNRKKDRELSEITRYIEQINSRNYQLNIDDNTEDELSILKNEIYKTTVMLREAADNSLKDKAMLKDSISDISHQLRTPITSVLITLDNIIDSPDMDGETRMAFLRRARAEILNISFLTESLLKLSKFDSNTVAYINREENIYELLTEAADRVSLLADLKNVAVKISGDTDDTILCDRRWQTEAFANILKNCIEHSAENSEIAVTFEQNKVYAKVEIKDCGCGIDKTDLPHIFERFYKGKNSSKNSIGIGLALSKAIIEAGGGYISVSSEKNVGTVFTIKYPV